VPDDRDVTREALLVLRVQSGDRTASAARLLRAIELVSMK
jgi:hypothetical protein